jgi:hypothetical protein
MNELLLLSLLLLLLLYLQTKVSFVKSLTIRRLGHIERINNNGMLKTNLNAKMEGGRRRRRPSKRWLNDVESDIKSLGIRN